MLVHRGILAVFSAVGLTASALAASGAGQQAADTPAACVSSAEVVRIGKPLPGGDGLITVVVTSVGAAEGSVSASIAWCLETTVPACARSATVWHDPSDPATTRVTVGPDAYEVRAVRDAAGAVLLKAAPGVTIYDLI